MDKYQNYLQNRIAILQNYTAADQAAMSAVVKFSSIPIVALVQINVACIVGYPIFLSQISHEIVAEHVEDLKTAFWLFVASFFCALGAALMGYANGIAMQHFIRKEKEFELHQIENGLYQQKDIRLEVMIGKSNKVIERMRPAILALNGFMVMGIMFGLISAGLLVRGVWEAAQLIGATTG